MSSIDIISDINLDMLTKGTIMTEILFFFYLKWTRSFQDAIPFFFKATSCDLRDFIFFK